MIQTHNTSTRCNKTHTDLKLKDAAVCLVIIGNAMIEPIKVWVGYTGRWKMPYCTENFDEGTSLRKRLDVRGSVHHTRSKNHIEITNKMQLFTRVYYSSVY